MVHVYHVLGKIKDSSQPCSISEPANSIGEHLHSDLIPLGSNASIGGNTFILFAVDEKSGYCIGVPIKSNKNNN
jgi:hypothetical protein